MNQAADKQTEASVENTNTEEKAMSNATEETKQNPKVQDGVKATSSPEEVTSETASAEQQQADANQQDGETSNADEQPEEDDNQQGDSDKTAEKKPAEQESPVELLMADCGHEGQPHQVYWLDLKSAQLTETDKREVEENLDVEKSYCGKCLNKKVRDRLIELGVRIYSVKQRREYLYRQGRSWDESNNHMVCMVKHHISFFWKKPDYVVPTSIDILCPELEGLAFAPLSKDGVVLWKQAYMPNLLGFEDAVREFPGYLKRDPDLHHCPLTGLHLPDPKEAGVIWDNKRIVPETWRHWANKWTLNPTDAETRFSRRGMRFVKLVLHAGPATPIRGGYTGTEVAMYAHEADISRRSDERRGVEVDWDKEGLFFRSDVTVKSGGKVDREISPDLDEYHGREYTTTFRDGIGFGIVADHDETQVVRQAERKAKAKNKKWGGGSLLSEVSGKKKKKNKK